MSSPKSLELVSILPYDTNGTWQIFLKLRTWRWENYPGLSSMALNPITCTLKSGGKKAVEWVIETQGE